MTREKASINFYKDELWCPCCGVYNIVPELLEKLQDLRTYFNAPIVVNSGYRCKAYNSSIKKASKNSQHCLGRAVDIACRDSFDRYAIVAKAIALGFRGIHVDNTFIHLDVRTGPRVFYVTY
jgi:uncharacterized protein YcbK (DUF882 family)